MGSLEREGGANEHSASTARIHRWARRRGGLAARGAGAATRDASACSCRATKMNRRLAALVDARSLRLGADSAGCTLSVTLRDFACPACPCRALFYDL